MRARSVTGCEAKSSSVNEGEEVEEVEEVEEAVEAEEEGPRTAAVPAPTVPEDAGPGPVAMVPKVAWLSASGGAGCCRLAMSVREPPPRSWRG